EFNSDDETDEALVNLKKALAFCNAVLYTRRDPWQIMLSRIEHDVPVRYADIDGSNLIQCLLEASYHLKVDILRPSVDTLGYGAVMGAYRSVGIPESEVQAQLIQTEVNDLHFVQKTYEAHKLNYQNRLCSFCATNIRSVRDRLASEGIPCVLLAPNMNTYLYEIRRLMVSHSLKEADSSKNVVAAILLQPRNDFYQKTALQEVLDQNKAAECIALFAQRTNGALITLGATSFLIISNSAEMEDLTERYTKIDLLWSIATTTSFVVAIGIGYGQSIKEAKAYAEIGAQRAMTDHTSQAYVVYSPTNLAGPIQPNELNSSPGSVFEQRLVRVAEASALSISTVCRIDSFARRKKEQVVTSFEIAQELGVSVRTANRIVSKLEICGYIAEVGTHVTGDRGRPTRMLKVLF
ncbi:MAG: helix-turn-helix domain-containing protein, partial [Clostridiales bacterium]|nr:helix-turn-helix domain-containing protein [Clostridiales bacterium]